MSIYMHMLIYLLGLYFYTVCFRSELFYIGYYCIQYFYCSFVEG